MLSSIRVECKVLLNQDCGIGTATVPLDRVPTVNDPRTWSVNTDASLNGAITDIMIDQDDYMSGTLEILPIKTYRPIYSSGNISNETVTWSEVRIQHTHVPDFLTCMILPVDSRLDEPATFEWSSGITDGLTRYDVTIDLYPVDPTGIPAGIEFSIRELAYDLSGDIIMDETHILTSEAE